MIHFHLPSITNNLGYLIIEMYLKKMDVQKAIGKYYAP